MLQITIPPFELYDERIGEFITSKGQTLQLEHSLVSLSKWESKWCKSFFDVKPKTEEESLDYVRCMTLTQNVKPEIYVGLTKKNVDDIYNYISAPMTATTFSDDSRNAKGKINGELITSELVYYWMIALNIPFECRKWHLNRLITLIRVCNIKNQPPKKMSKKEIMSRNTALNAARRKQYNTKG